MRAARGPAGRGATTVVEPAPSRDHTERMLCAPARASARRRRRHRTAQDELELDAHRGARRPLVGGVPRRGGAARARVADRARRDVGGQLDARRLRAHRERMGAHRRRGARGAPAPDARPRSRSSDLDVARGAARPAPSSRPTRCRWRSTSCRSSPCWAASPRARRRARAPRAARQGVRPDRGRGRRPARPRRRHRGAPRTASSCAGPAGCAAATIESRGDHRLAMLGAVAGLASARASRSSGWTPRRSPTRASPADLARAGPSLAPMVDRDRRARRGRQVDVARAVAGGSASRTSTPAPCTAAVASPRQRDGADPAAVAGRPSIGDSRACSTATTSPRRSGRPEVAEAPRASPTDPGVRAAMVAKQRELIARATGWPRAATSAPSSRRMPSQGLPDGRPERARAPARRRARRRRRPSCCASRDARRARPTRGTRRSAGAATRSRSTRPG